MVYFNSLMKIYLQICIIPYLAQIQLLNIHWTVVDECHIVKLFFVASSPLPPVFSINKRTTLRIAFDLARFASWSESAHARTVAPDTSNHNCLLLSLRMFHMPSWFSNLAALLSPYHPTEYVLSKKELTVCQLVYARFDCLPICVFREPIKVNGPTPFLPCPPVLFPLFLNLACWPQ